MYIIVGAISVCVTNEARAARLVKAGAAFVLLMSLRLRVVRLGAASSADETGLVEANFGHDRASICRLAAIDFVALAMV
jgi:hypothetical protein